MSLFFSLLPLYIFGNLHCLGMCGPLVMFLGVHPFKIYYFLGRILSFSLGGLIAGSLGAVLHLVLKNYHIAENIAIIGGISMIAFGSAKMVNRSLFLRSNPSHPVWLKNILQKKTASLLTNQSKGNAFVFGLCTVLLPCGQTLTVFSACALVGDSLVGFGNGAALAILTSPALLFSMSLAPKLKQWGKWEKIGTGIGMVTTGILACCRGLAEYGLISHIILNPEAHPMYHLVIF